jgi:hypothetical protein
VPDPGCSAGEGPDSAVIRPADRDPAVLAEERTAGSPNPEMQLPAIFGVWISSSRLRRHRSGCIYLGEALRRWVCFRIFVGGCVFDPGVLSFPMTLVMRSAGSRGADGPRGTTVGFRRRGGSGAGFFSTHGSDPELGCA